MIYDHISNIERYRTLSPLVYQALMTIAEQAEQLPLGKTRLPMLQGCGDVCTTLGVDEYFTKIENPVGYETHVKYIDIQYLVSGEEVVKVRLVDTLALTTPYDAERDAAFYLDDRKPAVELTLGGGMFAIFFPTDAHQPQLASGCPRHVKKIVAKVPVVNGGRCE